MILWFGNKKKKQKALEEGAKMEEPLLSAEELAAKKAEEEEAARKAAEEAERKAAEQALIDQKVREAAIAWEERQKREQAEAEAAAAEKQAELESAEAAKQEAARLAEEQRLAAEAEAEAMRQAEEARREAEARAEEARLKAEADAAAKAAALAAEAEAARLAEEQRQKAEAEAEAMRLAEKARQEAEARAEEARRKAEADAAAKAAAEAAEAEAARLAEEERLKAEAEAEAKRRAEEARLEAEARAEEARRQAEADAAAKAAAEAAEAEAQRLAEEEAARKAAEAKAAEEAEAARLEAERLAAEAEARAKAEAERLAAAEKAAAELKLLEERRVAERLAAEREEAARKAEEERQAAIARGEVDPMAETRTEGFFNRLSSGLARSSSKLTESISSVFTKRKLDDDTLEELEDLLIVSDLGATVAARVTANLAKDRFDKEVTGDEIRSALAQEITEIMKPREQIVDFSEGSSPRIVMFVGVNGSGKTTTIGKIASKLKDQGAKALLVAGDTFRAAAIEQLTVWGDRADIPVLSKATGADAAGLVYEAVEKAKEEDLDLVLIDTAGRLQNKAELMSELEKIVRVTKKLDPSAPHDVILVLDATVGQNALSQVEAFKETAGVTGLVMTKLDGTAKGGVLVAIAEAHDLPIHFIGVGEKAEDLQPFSAEGFARALVGDVG